MQIKYTLLCISLITTSMTWAGNLIKITNDSKENFTLLAHAHRGKKYSIPLLGETVWTGALELNNTIHITSQNKETIFTIEKKPTYLAITTYKNNKNFSDLRINLQDIFNNAVALIKKTTSQTTDGSYSEKSPWSISLSIDNNNQIALNEFIFEQNIKIPARFLKSYTATINNN